MIELTNVRGGAISLPRGLTAYHLRPLKIRDVAIAKAVLNDRLTQAYIESCAIVVSKNGKIQDLEHYVAKVKANDAAVADYVERMKATKEVNEHKRFELLIIKLNRETADLKEFLPKRAVKNG